MWLLSLFLAYLFLNTGMAKLLYRGHTLTMLRKLLPFLPQHQLKPLADLLMISEFGIASLLLTYPLVLVGLMGASVAFCIFIIGIVAAASKDGPEVDCGCGPVATKADYAASCRNLILLSTSIGALMLGTIAGNPLDVGPLIYEFFAFTLLIAVVVPSLWLARLHRQHHAQQMAPA